MAIARFYVLDTKPECVIYDLGLSGVSLITVVAERLAYGYVVRL
jgi:hypothetical protein